MHLMTTILLSLIVIACCCSCWEDEKCDSSSGNTNVTPAVVDESLSMDKIFSVSDANVQEISQRAKFFKMERRGVQVCLMIVGVGDSVFSDGSSGVSAYRHGIGGVIMTEVSFRMCD